MTIDKHMDAVKVLVVDDDPAVGRVMSSFLHQEGYAPVVCSHPKEALELVKDEHYCLAFVDINMPELSGLDLAAKLKSQKAVDEVIFITGYGTFDNAIQAIKIGAYDYMQKPFGLNEVQLCLKRFQERQELKEQIRLVEQRYFNLVQNIPSIVFLIHSDFRLAFINRACDTMLGYTQDDALGDPGWFVKRIHPDDHQRIKGLFESAFHSGDSRFSADCRFMHKDGHIIYTMIGAIILKDTGREDENSTLQGMIIDITDRVFFERSVVQEEKMKILGSISAEVAHEIRNPLMAIGGFARRLRKRFHDLPEGDIILSESQRLEMMLKRLAEYLKPIELEYQECLVNSIVRECVDRFDSDMNDKTLEFSLNMDSGISSVYADREILVQIFIDLIRNAASELEKCGRIDIRTYESDRTVHVEFKNQCRMTISRDPESFFMPFGSSEHGIDLANSYRLLKNMDGLLSFSQGENFMTFTVSIPKKDLPPVEPKIN